MFKKVLASSSILFLALFLVSTSVFAATTDTTTLTKNQQEALRIIETANAEIAAKIDTAVAEADALQATYVAEIREIQIKEKGLTLTKLMAERKAEYTKVLNEISTTLYNETLAISQEAIRQAAKLGVKAECSWVLVKLADTTIWIDPIAVSM
ncbi:hypothetical protein [Paenibacillus wynnii]|uniref:Uncharacterized protein n=1 Tax=Paenibacillus wynnii TaxID=268407 RepID=A0A098MDV9_9BACL|nr:hypothetical protein [Paenibacillus wynnii]KGE20238.1 hypothetical protein PWYN_13530 [Paenibacillus wynnii]